MKKTKLLAFILTCAIFLSTLIVPIAAAEDDTTQTSVVIYQTRSVTMDGAKGINEYGDTPSMAMDTPVWNGTFDHAGEATAASYPNLYLSTDGDNLYVFYEVAQSLINDGGNTRIWFAFETSADALESGWGAAGKEGYDGCLEILFGHNYESNDAYGLTAYKCNSSTSINDMSEIGIDVQLGHESYMKVNGTEELAFTVEIKIPLMSSVKDALTKGDAEIHFGAYQRYNFNVTRKDNGDVVNTWCLTNSTGWSKTDALNSATLSILPRPIIAGFQSRPTPEATDSVDVRFVSVMKADAEKLANMEAGYDFTYYRNVGETGTEATVNCTKVYASLSADGDTLNATNYGGNYFFCYTISELSYGSSYTFDVACWTRENGKTTESIETVRVTITVSEAGEVSFTY